jgi:hypothetical protein
MKRRGRSGFKEAECIPGRDPYFTHYYRIKL